MNFETNANGIAVPQSRYIVPQFEERTSYGFRRIDPYAKLFEDRIIYLGTPHHEETLYEYLIKGGYSFRAWPVMHPGADGCGCELGAMYDGLEAGDSCRFQQEQRQERCALGDAMVQAAIEAGIPANDDFNGARQEGVGYYQTTTSNRRRWSSARPPP